MPNRPLKLKPCCKIASSQQLYEGYSIADESITANVSVDKIEEVMMHFLGMHQKERVFFILEIPAKKEDTEEKNVETDVYYIDGLEAEEAAVILERVGELLYNDGLSSFGFGGHESQDEIMYGKYNVVNVFTHEMDSFDGFFEEHEIFETDNLITGWDTLSRETPGTGSRYEKDGRTVFDIPEMFKEWGMYLAEQR